MRFQMTQNLFLNQNIYKIFITRTLKVLCSFPIECAYFRSFVQTAEKRPPYTTLLSYLKTHNLKLIFLNATITLRIYACTAAINCSTKRAFSMLKRIKNYLRAMTRQGRPFLNELASDYINSDLLDKLLLKFSR